MKFKQSNGRTKMTKELNHIEAFIKAQQEMPQPLFNNKNPHFKNKFADLSEISRSCREALLNNNLSAIQTYKFLEVGEFPIWGVLTKIVYADGTVVSDSFYPINCKLDDQKKGSATTYGRRYSLAMACNLVAEEDDDGNKASEIKKWQGPLKVTELKAELRNLSSALDACGTPDKLDEIILEFEPVMAQAKVDLEAWYERAKKRLDEIIEISDLTRAGKADMHDVADEAKDYE